MHFLDTIELANPLKDVTDACVSDAASEALLPCKAHAVVRQNGMYTVREDHKHLSKELCCVRFRGPVTERDMREFCDAVYGDKQVLSAAGELHFGAINVHKAQRRFFKLSVPSLHMRWGLSTDFVTLRHQCKALALGLGAVSSNSLMRSSSERSLCLRKVLAECPCSCETCWLAPRLEDSWDQRASRRATWPRSWN